MQRDIFGQLAEVRPAAPPDRDVEAVADEKQGRKSRHRIGSDDTAARRGTFDAEVGIEGAIEDVSRERFDERVRSGEVGGTSPSREVEGHGERKR